MSDADVDAIRRSHELVDYIGRFVELKKNGSEFRGLCPFHDDHSPSLWVNPSKQLWACFSCGAHEDGADLFGFVMKWNDCTFPQALEKLGNGSQTTTKPTPRKIEKPKPRTLLVPPPDDKPDLDRRDFGAPSNVWVIRTLDGSPWFYEARYMVDGKKETRYYTYGRYAENDTPRWECKHPTNPRPFYGLEQLAAKPKAQVMIHEAPKKAEAAAKLFPAQAHLGIVGGANQVPNMDLAPLAGRKIVLMPDNDEAGEQAMGRLAARLKQELGLKEVKGVDVETQPDGTPTPVGWDIADAVAWTPQIAMAWAKQRTLAYEAADPAQDAPERAQGDPSPGNTKDTDKPAIAKPRANGAGGTPKIPLSPKQLEEQTRTEALAGIVYTCIADVEAEAVKWLWPGRIPLGELTMIVGDPGLGKSQICASLAAVVTNGGQWPVTRERCEQGSVLILSAEDNIRHTIRPRLDAAGADVTRCHTLQAIRRTAEDGSSYERSFSLAEDLAKLSILMQHLKDVRLVVIDPVSAYLGETDSHKNAEVRGMLAPLTTLAGQHRAAILLVSHLTKSQTTNALMRVQGSIAFAALCRAVWGVARDQDDQERRLFMPLKNNLGEDKTGLAYSIEGYTIDNAEPIPTSRILWEADLVDKGAEEVFGANLTHEERTQIDDAKDLLRETLAGGPVRSPDVERAATASGINRTTLFRAKKQLNVKATREGGIGRLGVWYWQLPKQRQAESAEPSWVPD